MRRGASGVCGVYDRVHGNQRGGGGVRVVLVSCFFLQ